MNSELFVDGGLLEPGNHEGVRRMSVLAATRLIEIRRRACIGHDDALDFLLTALNAIGAGESPNNAFGWTRPGGGAGAPKGNLAFRDWDIRMTVQAHMREKGRSKEKMKVCGEVSIDSGGEFLLSFDTIKDVCRGMTVNSELPLPDNMYPIDPEPYRRKKTK
ncbi:MAG: hypothetical protein Q8L71_11910 [Thiobacillus sp.]|nr:hypothetical protein [Thiobacillus sp.]